MKIGGLHRWILPLAMLGLFYNCTKEHAFDCFTSKGKTVSQLRNPGVFTKVKALNQVDVVVFYGSDLKIEVITGQNLLKGITTKITDGELIINNENKCGFVRGYKHIPKVYVSLPYLEKATHEGVGTFKIENGFVQDTITLEAGGSGDFFVNGNYKQIRCSADGDGDTHIMGYTNSFALYTNGVNYIRAENLTVHDYIFIASLALGDVYVNCSGTGQMDYDIQSSGNILYTGNPGVLNNYSTGTAKGRAIKKD